MRSFVTAPLKTGLRYTFVALSLLLILALPMPAQDVRTRDVRDAAKEGPSAIPKLQEFLKNPNLDVRIEAVRQLGLIGTQRSLDPLIEGTHDNDPEVQIRAIDGLVNFYLPGYVQTGIGASLKRVGTGIKGHFTDTNDQVIPAFVVVRPEVIRAIGDLARGAASMDARAAAARAIGILRGKAAVPDLIEALHSKNTDVIYESLNALEKIRDESAAPRITFLLHDLDPKVQLAAIECTGLLLNKSAVPELAGVLNHARDARVRRAALTAIAMLPDPSSRSLYTQYLNDKDEKMRGAAAEGFARLANPADLPMLEHAWQDETKTSPRLSLAFALVMLGRTEQKEFSPLQYLINTLNSASYKGVAQPFLIELARKDNIRQALYAPMLSGTKDEKLGLLRVLSQSGDQSSIAQAQKLSNDPDPEVGQEALRTVRTLQARF
jgi:HEAT repeats